MKFRNANRHDDDFEINDSVVVCDEFHRDAIGLTPFASNCEVVQSIEQAALIIEDARLITLVDSRPEVLLAGLASLVEKLERSQDFAVGLLFPTWLFDGMLNFLSLSLENAELAVVELHADEAHTYIAFKWAKDDDRPLQDFLSGIEFGKALAGRNVPEQPDSKLAQAELTARLLSVVQSVPLIAATQKPSSAESHDGSLEKQLVELKKRITHLTAEKDMLQRKYESLSTSTLGRVTLGYWSWRRKG